MNDNTIHILNKNKFLCTLYGYADTRFTRYVYALESLMHLANY